LDKDIIAAFPTAFDGITKSIDAIVRHAPAHLFSLACCDLARLAAI
jgi:hypothetical protein